MSRLIRVIDNETIEISDYGSPNRCFETNEYGKVGNFDIYCVLKEKINPFSLYVENQRLNNIINETIKDIEHSTLLLEEGPVKLKDTPFGKRILYKLKGDDK